MRAFAGSGLLLSALLLAPVCARADLKSVLQKLGEDARARESAPPCRYREATTVDELGPDGKVLGSELRLYDVEIKGTEVLRRDRLSVTKTGEPLADLLQEPREVKAKKPARSPLHPDAQSEYRFELNEGSEPLTLTF